MTKTIKVDCDKWKSRLWVCGMLSAIIGWGLLTMGLIYVEYWWVATAFPQMHFQADYVIFTFIEILLLLGNGTNLYFVAKTIYNHQSIVEFKCVSNDITLEEDKRNASGSLIISNKEYFERQNRESGK